MKTIIAGSRSIKDYDKVAEVINTFHEKHPITEVVSGGAQGVDTLGEVWAERNGIPFKQFLAEWDIYGRSAGYRRNEEMGDYADCLLAIWDGKSRGTKHMIDYMRERGKEYSVWYPSL